MLQCTDLMHWSAQITHEDRSRRSRSQVHATGVPTSLLSRSASATPAQSGRPARHRGSLWTLPVRFASRDENKVCLSIVLAEGRSEVQPPSWTSCQVGALAVDGWDQQVEMISRGELASRPDRSARRACRVPTCPVRSQAGLWRRTAPMAKELSVLFVSMVGRSLLCSRRLRSREGGWMSQGLALTRWATVSVRSVSP